MLARSSAGGVPSSPLSAQSVLVFRALKLGDMLCAVPALRTLRAALPRARISLAGMPWADDFAARFSRYIDEFIPFPGHPDLPEQQGDPFRFRKFRHEMRLRCFGLAIQMHGSGTVTNEIVMSLGGRITAGFHPPDQTSPDPACFAPYPEGLSEIERNLALLGHLGMPAGCTDLEFPILPADGQELERSGIPGNLGPGSYVCIHPGASRRDKCWPLQEFIQVARAMRDRGLTVVVTGDRREADLAAVLCNALGGDCIDAASPDLGLGALALLIRDSRLLLCNDTGVSHLAAALGVPSVVVFSQADPGRWAPLDRTMHRALGGPGRPVRAEAVVQNAEELLRQPIQRIRRT